jgi:hypothetical protein
MVQNQKTLLENDRYARGQQSLALFVLNPPPERLIYTDVQICSKDHRIPMVKDNGGSFLPSSISYK